MRILTISTLLFLISIHCGVLAYPTETDLILSDDDLEAISINSTDNSLVERNEDVAIMMLPIPGDCKTMLKRSIPVAKAAFKWIKKTVCEDYHCKVDFAPVYKKYSIDPIKKNIIMEWIFGTMAKKGHPIQKVGIQPDKVFDKIVKTCIEGDRKIMGLKNVCHADPSAFRDLKSCVIGEVMEYVPKVVSWAGKACKIALEEKLVEKVFIPPPRPSHITSFSPSSAINCNSPMSQRS